MQFYEFIFKPRQRKIQKASAIYPQLALPMPILLDFQCPLIGHITIYKGTGTSHFIYSGT